MSLSPEEMFYLATGLLDLNSWTGYAKSRADKSEACCTNNENSRTKCAAHDNLGSDRTKELLAFPMFQSMHSVPSVKTQPSPRKNCCSSLSSLSFHAGRCSSESTSLGQISNSLNNMSPSPSSSSGRPSWRTIYLTMLVIFLAFSLQTAEGCSSRSTPKPRPPPSLPSPTPAVRPNITFQTYACPPAYATYYCLNGATCFTIKIGESILYNCECTDGFMGQRCEYKDLDGSYLPLREKIMLERASIAGGATVAVVLVVIISIIFYTYVRQQRKEQRLASFDQVTVDRIEIRSRSCSSCNSFGGCRFGVMSTKNDCLLHQQRLHPFALSADYKKVKHPNLISIDAHYAHALRLTSLASDPINKTDTPINILANVLLSNVTAECKASQGDQTVMSLPNKDWDCKTNMFTST
uniref:EGF-like domain-containing protein n=1 Tax=Daphnia galeata TaxID=27404 RepID=A0A8J2RFP6_9CRUS|nr:unnamed protein product [Daphnia galeata]